jgi:hypothetical protein
MRPPRLPEEILRRVIRLSCLNGWSVVIFAGVCAIGSLVFRDFFGALIGLLVTLGGAMEVRGHLMLKRNNIGGMRWLVASQLAVLAVIWAYAISRLLSYDDRMVREVITPKMLMSLNELGLTLADILPLVRRIVDLLYGSVLATTLIYQGGMALFYRHCTPAVNTALNPARRAGQSG